MHTETRVENIVKYISDVDPALFSEHQQDADIITWGDAHPVVWKIVTGHKSAPFGKNSYSYIGWGRGDSVASALHRAGVFKTMLEQPDTLFGWSAQFTMDHYGDKGFRGGFFRQFDGTYSRGCTSLDYTPDTLDDVVTRFLAWCDLTCKFPTREVRLDDKCIRSYP